MLSKYSLWTSALIVQILLFSSCLKSSNNRVEYPTDPQVYAISLSSKKDSSRLLPGIAFTIDQVKEKIFNKEPLPYRFHVDSAILRVSGSNNYYPFAKVELFLDRDCTYIWNSSDSIPLPRLQKIKTTAPDGSSTKTYTFQLNIHQKDPYILNWEKITGNWLPSQAESQRTIALNDRFFTYYQSGTEMKALSTPVSDGNKWNAANLSGIPHTIRLSSMIPSGGAVYALDAASGSVYRSSNGAAWSPVQTTYEVAALYGDLPPATSGSILLAVKNEGKLKFAQANNDLSTIRLLNDMPADIPVADFSVMKVESSTSYASKFIFLSGGVTADNVTNNDIWVLQENGDAITHIKSKRPTEGIMKGSSLFFYDEKPYLMAATPSGKNLLIYSGNYGTDWVKTEANQALPADFNVRTNASVITDGRNYIWIFGGVSSSNSQLTDIWRGRLNKFAN